MNKKLFSTIFLLVISVVGIQAQSKAEQSVANARDQFFDIKNRSIELERMKREAYKRPSDEDLTRSFPLIKEDFERIQTVNSEVLRLSSDQTALNAATISKFVSEINHRAVRLKENLFISEPDEKKEANKKSRNLEQQDVKKLFAALDASINKFVHNSIFQNINLVNSKDSLKAQKDLENIINISHAIKLKIKH